MTIANIFLGIAAGVLFLGVVAEKDKEAHKNITIAFVATLAVITVLNIFA
jgi:hypothetical protein